MQETEVSLVGTVAEARLPALLTRLTERCGAAGKKSSVLERRYASTLPPDARGLAELRLHSDLDGKNATCAAIPGRTCAERSVWDMRRRLTLLERVLTFFPSLLQAIFPER